MRVPILSARPKLLLVDDDPAIIAVLGRMLSELADVRFAMSGSEALRLARESVPDLVLLDVELGDSNGFEVCQAFKNDTALKNVPIIFVTSHDSVDQETTGLSLGAVDFISKPPSGPVVVARVRNHLALKAMTDLLRRSAATDDLTGLANRRHFDETLAREWVRAQRTSAPVSLLMIDVDLFKGYNDCYGHQAGDECLKAVAGAIGQVARRPADLAARYGGEEFAILLPETDRSGAWIVAQRLLRAVAALGLPHAASGFSDDVTVSIGVSAYDVRCDSWVGPPADIHRGNQEPRCSARELVAAADQALFAAKNVGRARALFLALDHVGLPACAVDLGVRREARVPQTAAAHG